MVGDHNLHPNVAIIAAGNLDTDKGVTHRISTPLQSRLVHYELEVSEDDWQEWAAKNNIHFKVRGFLKFRGELLHNFDPNHIDNTFACPRTHEFASKLMHRWDKLPEGTEKLSHGQLITLAGTLGEGVATEFNGFNEVYLDIPDISIFITRPMDAPIFDELSKRYAICSMISSRLARFTKTEIEPLMQYLQTLFQVW